MLKQLFGTRKTNKIDVTVAIIGVVTAALHAVGAVKQYKTDNDPETITEENNA